MLRLAASQASEEFQGQLHNAFGKLQLVAIVCLLSFTS